MTQVIAMNQVQITAFGGPDIVNPAIGSVPAATAHEAVVRVEMVGLNPLDLKIMAGYMAQVFPVVFPYVPGTDFSGVVETVGAAVSHVRPGDRVVGRASPNTGGAMAQRVVVTAADLVVMPSDMSFEQAAALPTAFGAARQALLDVGKLRASQRVLIHAAAGGVGMMAVQQAHAIGAHVTATTSAANSALVKSLGADDVVDYRAGDFGTLRDIDLVVDTMGGDTLARSWQVLGHGGGIVSLVEFGIQPQDGHFGEFVFFAGAVSLLQAGIDLYERGALQVIIDAIYPMTDTRAALEKLQTGHARGKILVRVAQ